ncbi:MAG: hypothetical protein ABIH34_02775, partial [Nanoarchaeota archaeon]
MDDHLDDIVEQYLQEVISAPSNRRTAIPHPFNRDNPLTINELFAFYKEVDRYLRIHPEIGNNSRERHNIEAYVLQHFRIKEKRVAEEFYSKILEFDKENLPFKISLARCLSQQDNYFRAWNLMVEVLSKAHEYPDVISFSAERDAYLAWHLFQVGEPVEKVHAIAKRAIEGPSRKEGVFFAERLVGWCYFTTDRFESAEIYFESALNKHETTDILLDLAQIKTKLDKFDEAHKYLNRVKPEDRKFTRYETTQAILKIKLKKYRDAKDHLLTAMRFNDCFQGLYYGLAYVNAHLGNFEEAITNFSKYESFRRKEEEWGSPFMKEIICGPSLISVLEEKFGDAYI